MTDEELISNYLSRYYKVIVATNYKTNISETELMIGEFESNNMYSKSSILSEIQLVFKGLPDLMITFELWFYKSLRKLEVEFDKFLSDCEMVLGHTNWIVRHKLYGEIQPDLLTTYNNNEKSHILTLKYLFDKWCEDKVIEASEKAWVNSYR